MTFSRLFASLTRYTRIILILGLIVLAGAGSQIGGVNVYAGTVENGCKDGKPPTVKGGVQICTLKYDNGTKGVFNTEATFVDNKFTGLQNCYLNGDKGSATGNNCAGFALSGLNIGDNISEINAVDDGWFGEEQARFKILNPNAVGNDPKNFSGNKCDKEEKLDELHLFYKCKDGFVIQNIQTGKYSINISQGSDGDGLGAAFTKEQFKKGFVKGKDGKLVDKSTLSGLAPSQIDTLKPEQVQAVDDQIKRNQQIIDLGAQSTPIIVITCEVPRFDAKGNISSVCKGGDGKYYTKDANGKLVELKDKCIGVTRDANAKIVNNCYTEDLNKVDAALPINATLQPIADANKKEKAALAGVTGDKSNSALDLVKSLGAIVGWVLFFLIYFFGWILSFLLYMISVLFVEILSINPAAPAFIGAAVRPWQVLVGLANLVVLGTFIAIGLGYILDYKPLKRNIREFILQIAVFALLLQFSLLGTGVVVNLATGIGDAMVYSYAGPVTSTGRPNYSRLIGGFVKAINNISAVRCGKTVEATKKAEFCDVDVSSVPFETDGKNQNGVNNIKNSFDNIGTFLGDTTKGPAENALFDAGIQGILLQYLLFESIYVLVMFYAITQMFQALGLVIFRLVGLWMLMVTSPVALALYLAPAKSLQKYATEWLDKFWKATFFYPFFILALVLHTKLVSAIAVALNVGQTLSKGTDTGDISPLSMAVIVAAGTLAGVSIVGLALVIKWFKDSFGAIVEAAMKGLGKAFGALKVASYATGTGLKIGGKALSGLGSLADKNVFGGRFGAAMTGLSNGADARIARGGFFNKTLGGAMKIGSKFKLGSALGGAGNVFDFLPTSFDTATAIGKDGIETVKRLGKARTAGNVQGQLGNVELAARKLGLGRMLDNTTRLKTLQNETSESLAEDPEIARTELKNAKNKAYDDIAGKKFEDSSQARRTFARLKKQIQEKGIGSLKPNQLSDFRRLATRAVETDSTMFEEMVSDISTRELLTSIMPSIDSKTRAQFEEKELLGMTNDQKTQVVSAWSGKDILNKLNNRMLLDPVVQDALRDNININDEDLDAKIRSANQSNIGVMANERARNASNILNNPAAMSAFNQGVANTNQPIGTATAATFFQAANNIYSQAAAGGAIPDESVIKTAVTSTFNVNMDAQYGAGVSRVAYDAPDLQAQIQDIYKKMPLAELIAIPFAEGLTKTSGYQKLDPAQKKETLQEFLSANAKKAVSNSAVDLASITNAVTSEVKARVGAENSARPISWAAGVTASYVNQGTPLEVLVQNQQFRDALAIPQVTEIASRSINNQSGQIPGFGIDMSTIAVQMQSAGAREKLEQKYQAAVIEYQRSKNINEFNAVESILTKANGGVAVSFDPEGYNDVREEKGQEQMDALILDKKADETTDQVLHRKALELKAKAKEKVASVAEAKRKKMAAVFNTGNPIINPIKVTTPRPINPPR